MVRSLEKNILVKKENKLRKNNLQWFKDKWI